MRQFNTARKTKETDIQLKLNLDGSGQFNIKTGIGFFDHMLEQLAFHASFDMQLEVQGDLHIDAHHSIEDVGILIGETIHQALDQKIGIVRYGSNFLPMDETLCRTVLDLSGRAYHVFQCQFHGYELNTFPLEMVAHFFYSIAINAKMTLHQEILYGKNDHHKTEALFKSFARALKIAIQIESNAINSTKGVL